MRRWLLLLPLLGGLYWFWPALERGWPDSQPVLPPGQLAPAAPRQAPVAPVTLDLHGYRLTALARYDLTVRVLGRRGYWLDRESDLAPLDLAVGWQQMSDSAVLDHIQVTQQFRWYLFQIDAGGLDPGLVLRQSANMHMIPATPAIRRQLGAVPAGSLVHLQGYLVEAQGQDGWRWASSLTRDDTGAHSCELMLVTAVERKM